MSARSPGKDPEGTPEEPRQVPGKEPIRRQLESVLESTAFSRSSRLSRFLRFVVERSLDGQEEKLKEYTLGVEVFDRGESFDPRVETIVRVEARRLRNRLRDYYEAEGGADPVLIEIPKGGYKPAFRCRQPPPEIASERRDPRTVVVLPFTDMSAERDHAYLCDGLTEEMTHALTQVAGIGVISRTSAFAFKERKIDIREIGERLGAGMALEGSLRVAEERVRITAQLISTSDGRHLWSDRFDRDLRDIFELQDSVATEVVGHLTSTLGLEAAPGPEVRPKGTNSLEAYDRYLEGRFHSYQYTPEGRTAAIDCYERAIALDCHYAQPWAALAEAHAVAAILGWAAPHDVMPLAKKAAVRALEIDDRVAGAHAALALVLFRYDYRWDEAGRAYERALELRPGSGSIRNWYPTFLLIRQRPRQALAEARRAAELDPLAVEPQRVIADTLYFARRHDEAIEQGRKILSHHPDYYLAHFYNGMALVGLDRLDEAVAALREANRLAEQQPLTRSVLGWGLGMAGERLLAERAREELLQVAEREDVPAFLIAMIDIGMGEGDRALERLESAYQRRDSMLPLIQIDEKWDSLRDHARFQSLLERIGLA